ncbi:hypothetical protein AnigIFM56816_003574 [Aspergillus niger]|nr:hypothetical protein AnigIFM56816_003574 [Aspergillus niger]
MAAAKTPEPQCTAYYGDGEYLAEVEEEEAESVINSPGLSTHNSVPNIQEENDLESLMWMVWQVMEVEAADRVINTSDSSIPF